MKYSHITGSPLHSLQIQIECFTFKLFFIPQCACEKYIRCFTLLPLLEGKRSSVSRTGTSPSYMSTKRLGWATSTPSCSSQDFSFSLKCILLLFQHVFESMHKYLCSKTILSKEGIDFLAWKLLCHYYLHV